MPLMLRLALFLTLGEPAFLFCRSLRTGTLVPSLFACFLLELQGLLCLGAYAGVL